MSDHSKVLPLGIISLIIAHYRSDTDWVKRKNQESIPIGIISDVFPVSTRDHLYFRGKPPGVLPFGSISHNLYMCVRGPIKYNVIDL